MHQVSISVYTNILIAKHQNALDVLVGNFVKRRKIIFGWYVLATTSQSPEEGSEQDLQSLKFLSRDCDFQATTADQVNTNLSETPI